MAEEEQTKKRAGRVEKPFAELGVAGSHDPNAGIRGDEFILALRGQQGIKKLREMRENDPVVGALLFAMDMMIRSVHWRVEPAADGGTEAIEAAEFVESLMDDMSHTWSEFLSDVVSFLPYGFSFFEVIYKRRDGDVTDPARHSKHSDGKIGVRKLAPRAQWTIEGFKVDPDDGGVLGVYQNVNWNLAAPAFIPISKGLLFRTSTENNDPAGRSVLRSAYISWHYINNIQKFEAIGIERELNGLPVARVPAEYLSDSASSSQKAFRQRLEEIIRDIKRNEQGYIILPSDTYPNTDGGPSDIKMVDIELMASKGTRDIATSDVIKRHQQDLARSVLADFVMLGQQERGSFALSKSKTDLFLRALEGFMDNIASVLNRFLLPRLWELNGMDKALLPTFKPEDVAPPNLQELGDFVQKLAGAGAPLFPDDELEDVLRHKGGLPPVPEDREVELDAESNNPREPNSDGMAPSSDSDEST